MREGEREGGSDRGWWLCNRITAKLSKGPNPLHCSCLGDGFLGFCSGLHREEREREVDPFLLPFPPLHCCLNPLSRSLSPRGYFELRRWLAGGGGGSCWWSCGSPSWLLVKGEPRVDSPVRGESWEKSCHHLHLDTNLPLNT